MHKGIVWVSFVLAALGTSAFTNQSSPVLTAPQNWAVFGIVFLIIILVAILLIVQSRLSSSAAACYHLDHHEHVEENAVLGEAESEPEPLFESSSEVTFPTAAEVVVEQELAALDDEAPQAVLAATSSEEEPSSAATENIEPETITATSSEEALAAPIPEKAPAEVNTEDLTRIEGIGPKIALVLNQVGIFTYDQLANSDVDTLKATLVNAGTQFSFADPSTWPEQAGLLAAGEVDKFEELIKSLQSGRKV